MLTSKSNIDLDRLSKFVSKVDKQVVFATARALTFTAKAGQLAGEEKLQRILNAPIRRTVKSFYIKGANKQTLTARIFLKDYYPKGTAPSSYLTMFTGGPRPHKRSEGALRSRGKLGKGQYITPASIRLNKNGNVTKGMMNKILSGIKAQRDRYQDSSASKYFVINSQIGHLKKNSMSNGIYQRTARGVKKLFHIVDKSPQIRKTFDFDSFQRAQAKKNYPRIMRKSLQDARRTAK